MEAMIERRIVRQRAEDLLRLANQGERRGVRILLSPTGQHIATSASDPTRCYRVDLNGCECKGFAFWGRCQHHSLFLAELGRLDPDAEPAPTCFWCGENPCSCEEPPAAALAVPACHRCHGAGFVKMQTGGGLSDWEAVACRACTAADRIQAAA